MLIIISGCDLQSMGRSVIEYKKVSGQISLGDTKENVLSILLPTQKELDKYPHLQKSPEKHIKDNVLVEIYFMRSSINRTGVVVGDEFTPYVFNDGKLVGIALGDFTRNTFSAVYTFYINPHPQMSLGVFSILKQIQFSRECGIRYFYLGYFILKNRSLNYKANFKPNEVFINNEWVPYKTANDNALVSDELLNWKNSEFLIKETQRGEEFRGDMRVR